MSLRFAVPALFSLVLAAGAAGTAHAAPFGGDAPPANHGTCVSSAPKAEGKGGRSAVAQDRGTCTPQLACEEIGDVDLDSARNIVAVTDADPSGSALVCDAEIAADAGDLLTFDYTLENGTCGGGISRMYVIIDGTLYNTFDDNTAQCGVGGTVTYVVPVTGTVTEIGFVSDRRDGKGTAVTYSNAQLDGVTLNI